MRLLAVDPGLASTGLVLFERRAIVGAWTLRTAADGVVPDFAQAVQRGKALARQLDELREWIDGIELVVAEAYVDIGGHLRGARNRWTTPLAIGLLVPALESLAPVVWQDPALVMTRYRDYARLWALGNHGVVPGDEKLRNEHLRSAAAHGLFWLDTHKAVLA